MAEDTQGNPKAVDNAVFGSSEDFFTALENDVNSGIVDKMYKVILTRQPLHRALNQLKMYPTRYHNLRI